MKGIPKVWRPDEIARFKEMWLSGVKTEVMARHFELASTTVNSTARRWGLEVRKPQRPEKYGGAKINREWWVRDRKKRKCLGCRVEFVSRGKWTFLCDDCKSRKAWKSGGDFEVRA